jgi:restriction endonuclease
VKLQFDPNLDFWKQAVASIVDIFKGQEACRTNFTVAPLKREDGWLEGMEQNDLFRNFVVKRMIGETKTNEGTCFETFRRINISATK